MYAHVCTYTAAQMKERLRVVMQRYPSSSLHVIAILLPTLIMINEHGHMVNHSHTDRNIAAEHNRVQKHCTKVRIQRYNIGPIILQL